VKLIKYSAFALLTVVSMYLSINMFISLGADIPGKVILALVALGLESTKVFSLLRVEYVMHLAHKTRREFIGALAPSLAVYLLLAALSIVASIGFTQVTVDRQVETSRAVFISASEDFSFEIKSREQTLSAVDSQLAALTNQMQNLGTSNPDYVSSNLRISSAINELQAARTVVISEIEALRRQQRTANTDALLSTQQNVYGMFLLMGNAIGLDEKQVMLYLLLLVSVLIEVSMVYTSPALKIDAEEIHELHRKATPLPNTRTFTYSAPVAKQFEAVEITEIGEEETSSIASVETAQLAVQDHSPHIITTQQQKQSAASKWETIIPKLLQPSKGSELRDAASLSYELGVSVDRISTFFNKLSTVRGPAGTALLSQKDAKWHLNYMKEMVISHALAAMKKGSV
jgi:hypothetical protein